MCPAGTMKLFPFLLLALEALPLATSARPLFPQPNQQALASTPPPTPPSPQNSFGSSSDLESSSGSSSDRNSKKFSLPNPFNKNRPSSSEFRCYRYQENSVLDELFLYVTNLLRSYCDKVSCGKGDQEWPRPETCYAGYKSSDVSPSIYFGNMKAQQRRVVEKLFRNNLLVNFPDVRIEKAPNAFAVVMGDRQKIKRRNTV